MRLNSFLRFFQRSRSKSAFKGHTAKRRPTQARPVVEFLEDRVLLTNDVPTIISSSVLPLDGSSTNSSLPVLQVKYSEPMTASAANAANYVLLGSSGTPIPINTVALDLSQTLATITYNSSQPLVVDTYSLFVRGDKIVDVDDGLALSQPGQLIVANAGRNNLGVAGFNGDGTIGALSNYNLPSVGTQTPNPLALASGDLDGDGIPDLVVANAGTNQVAIYKGRLAANGGGFNSTPDLTLNLPAGTANLAKAVIVTDLNGDGKLDIAVASSTSATAGSTSVFLNTNTTPGNLSIGAGTTLADTGAAVGLVAADFDGDGVKDLAVAVSNAATDINVPVDSVNDYRIDIFRGTGGGGFAAAVPIRVGDVTPTGLTAPSSIAAGLLDADGKVDLAVGGSNGIALLRNTSGSGGPQAITFAPPTLILSGSSIVDLGTGITTGSITTASEAGGVNPIVITSANHGLLTGAQVLIAGSTFTAANGVFTITKIDANSFSLNGTNAAGSGIGGTWTTLAHLDRGANTDLIATTTTNQVVLLQNDGLMNFQATNFGVTSTAGRVAIGDLNADGLADVVVSNAVAPVGGVAVLLNNSLGGGISAMTGPGVGPGPFPVTVTSYNHGLTTGQQVVITGATGETVANNTPNSPWTVTVVDANHFTLNTANANANYTGGGFWVLTGTISTATEAGGTTPIVITSNGHGLVTGDRVTIAGSSFAAANGTFTITRIDANTFSLNGQAPFPIGSGTGGTWTATASLVAGVGSPYSVDGTPVGVALVDTDQDGRLDLITANNTGNDISLMLGNGDGSFQVSSNTALAPTVTHSVAVADLNGDGLLDIVVVNNNGSASSTSVSVFAGQAGGTYAAPINYTPQFGGGGGFGGNGRSIVALSIGDFGNGHPDIFLVDSQDSSVSILKNVIATPGAAFTASSFTALSPITVGNTPNSIVLADFDHDGKLDMAVSHNGNGGGGHGGGGNNNQGITVRLGNGDGTFQTAAEYLNNTAMVGLAVGDFNKDGSLDLVGLESQGGGFGGGNPIGVVHLLTGTGTGTFNVVATTFQTGITSPTDIRVADFNGDSFPDVVVASSSTSATSAGVSVLLNQAGTGFGVPFNDSSVVPLTGLQNILVNDVNQDGFPDIIASTQLSLLSGTVTSVTTDSPFVVRLNSTNGLVAGTTQIQLSNMNGLTNANTVWLVSAISGGGFGGSSVTLTSPPGVTNATVTGTYTNGGTWSVVNTGVNTADNVFVLISNGDGTFKNPTPYQIGGVGLPFDATSYLTATPSPLVRVTTFTTGGTTINGQLIKNGDFESRDLSTEQGDLLGWQTYKLPDNPGGSHGSWLAQTGTLPPLSGTGSSSFGTTVPTPDGTYRAMLDEANPLPISQPQGGGGGGGSSTPTNPNKPADYAGTQVLYQDVTIPAGATRVTLTLSLYLNNVVEQYTGVSPNVTGGTWSDATVTALLDYRTPAANQQVRVDIMDPNGQILGVTAATGVLRNEFITSPTTASTLSTVITDNNLTAFAGQTIRLRIAATNNQGRLLVGVDDVKINATFSDNSAPTITGLGLRNPGFLGNPGGTTPHTNDPTLIGRVGDAAGLAGISFVEFDPNNDGFGQADDLKTTQFDANGNFSFTLPTPPTGLQTIGVRVVDKAGNQFVTTFTFFMQANSVSEWEAVGPQGIDVTNQSGINYTKVSGRITTTVADLNDPTGNTYFVGSANGGIWKTSDGGSSWTPLTDSVTNANGTPVPVPIGGMAQSRSNPNVLYAGLGVADDALDSRSGSGVLKSTDGGRTWSVIGNSETVLANARVSKVVIDSNTATRVYVAVAAGGSGGPGVYRSEDGGLTWTIVFAPSGSVTDLVIDPFNSDRLLVGVGNIGLFAATGNAGLWRTTNKGGSWDQIVGGDLLNPPPPTVAVPNSTLPTGTTLGRVTLAIGNGRIGDERYVYVLIGNPPGNNTPPNVDFGTTFGLYRTKDNLLDWTKVKIQQDDGGGTHNFVDINLFGHDSANSGAMVVDPTDPNVVYIGGSTRWDTNGNTSLDHSLIRVDTGNMLDTTRMVGGAIPNNGDDATKAAQGNQQVYYDPVNSLYPYSSEGVYWYDLTKAQSGGTRGQGSSSLNLLPPAITSLTFDSQGRLLIGTIEGLWRGVPYGFGYDYTTGGTGIIRSGGGGGGGGGGGNNNTFTVPGMTLTAISGNLQISDMTSVAIDPLNRGTYFTTQIDTGVAGSSQALVWTSQGLTGPVVNGVNLKIPSAGAVLTANPAPGSPAGTPITLFRVWQYADPSALRPETSGDDGTTWSSIDSAGINTSQNPAGIFPAFAVNPNPVFESGLYQNELLFGTNKVFLTRTTSSVWDPISGVLGSGLISAMSFAPSQTGVYYVGNQSGQVFVSLNGGADGFPQRGAGVLPTTQVNGLTVDPNNYLIAYAMFGGAGNFAHVWKTADGGSSWIDISTTTGLPSVPAYGMVVDTNPNLGAPGGKLYLATEVGVFYSLNGGGTWSRLGQGLPNVPAVDISFNNSLQTLAVATLGRGVFTVDTSAISFVPDQVINEDSQTAVLPVTLNDPGLPAGSYTVGVTSSNAVLLPNDATHIVLGGTGASRTLQLKPLQFHFGTSTITITVTQGAQVFTRTFQLTVNFVNHLPVVSPIAAKQATNINTPLAVSFTVNDVEDPASGSISTAVGSGSSPIVITSTGHNLATGATVTITGSTFSAVNGTFAITRIDADHFSLNGTAAITGSGTGGTWSTTLTLAETSGNSTLVQNIQTGAISAANGAGGVNPIIISSTNHGLSTGNQVVISGSSFNAANGTFIITKIDSNHFSLNGTTTAGTGTGGTWTTTPGLILTGTGASRMLTISPLPGQTGVAPITLTVTDANGGVTTVNFSVLVTTTETLGFSDNFNRPDNPFLGVGWNENAGDWADRTNQGVSTVNGLNVATVNGLSAADVVVQSDVSALNGQWTGLVARYNATGDHMYYGVIIGTATGYQAAILLNNGGSSFAAVSSVNAFTGSASGTLRFEILGPSLKLFFNNTLVAFAGDTTLTAAGTVGYRTFGTVAVDNFSVNALTTSNGALTFNDNFSGTGAISSANGSGTGPIVITSAAHGLNTGTRVTIAGSTFAAAVGTFTITRIDANNFSLNGTSTAGSGTGGSWTNTNQQLSNFWLNRVGNYTVAANVATGAAGSTAQPVNLATVNGISAADVSVQANVNVANGQWSGLVARYTGPGDHRMYYGVLIGTSSGYLAGILLDNGSGFSAISAVQSYSGSATGTLRFDVVGPSLKLFFNNTLVAFAGDTTLTGPGTVGMRTVGATTLANFTASTLTLSPTGLPFSDGFNAAVNQQLSTLWLNRLGNYTVASGVATGAASTPTQPVNLATVNGVSAADVTVQADVNVANGQWSGLVARYAGTGDHNMYYGVIIGTASGYQAAILLDHGSGFSAISPVNTFSGSAIGNLRFEVLGPSLKLFLGDTLVANASDTTLSAAGTVGMRTVGTTTLDNFAASVLVPTSAPFPFSDNFSNSGTITTATGSGGPIIIASPGHGLNTGARVTITGSTFAAVNSTFTIMRIDANNFSLNGTSTVGSGTGGTWAASNQQLSNYWLERAGHTTVASGVATGAANTFNLATVNGLSVADVTVQANVVVGNGQWAGLMARYSGPGDQNMYLATIIGTSNGYVATIWRNVGGNLSVLGSTGILGPSGFSGLMSFHVSGSSLQLSLNGTLIAAVTDTGITGAGTVGMRTYGSVTMAGFQAS